jgi:hypothetical protein
MLSPNKMEPNVNTYHYHTCQSPLTNLSLVPFPTELACVLNRHDNSAYVHYLNQDKRLDEWVREANIRLADAQHQGTHQLQHPSTLGPLVASDVRKRKRRKVDGQGVPLVGAEAGAATGVESSLLPGIGEEGSASASGTPEPSMGLEELEHGILGIDEEAAVFGESMIPMTEEEYDILHHKQIGARRNFEKVYFGQWEIRTWFVHSISSRQCVGIPFISDVADVIQVLVTLPIHGSRG